MISVSKVGKSWLAYDLALSIITGRYWLGRFPTAAGKVLLIDNELHRGTLANRIPAVAKELGIQSADYERELEVWPLRGNLRALAELASDFKAIPKNSVKAIILDAKYRFASPDKSENENAAETQLYNLLDQYAETTGAAFVLVHHSSKGDQSGKRITDVGAGAGAQSRAADCHLILREHEEEGIVVLEAAVRSFAPVEPLPLRWDFPLWRPACDVDPTQLRGRLSPREQRKSEEDRKDSDKILEALAAGPAREPQLRPITGLKRHRQSSLLDQLVAAGHAGIRIIQYQGNEAREYYLSE